MWRGRNGPLGVTAAARDACSECSSRMQCGLRTFSARAEETLLRYQSRPPASVDTVATYREGGTVDLRSTQYEPTTFRREKTELGLLARLPPPSPFSRMNNARFRKVYRVRF